MGTPSVRTRRAPVFPVLPALMILTVLVLLGASLRAAAAPYAAMVMDARTGEVLHSANADTRLHPASLTKMMTLYIAFEAVEHGEIGLDDMVTISRKAAAEVPSKLGLRAGSELELRYLIRAAALKSANDAATAIPRLLDMGAEPFLLASTLELVGAQRLARRLCTKCRHSVVYTAKELAAEFPLAKAYFPDKKTTLYRAKGCLSCNHTGYQGRIALFELIPVDETLRELVLRHPSRQEIWQLARKQGAISLFEDGVAKVQRGITSLEELLRIASPPEHILDA